MCHDALPRHSVTFDQKVYILLTPHTHTNVILSNTISLHTTSATTTPGVPTGHDQATTE